MLKHIKNTNNSGIRFYKQSYNEYYCTKTAKMLDSQNRLQNCFKNTKTAKFFSELTFYTSEGHTCKVLSFYDFWFTFNDKFCSPYPIVDFYAYLITKIGNRNLNGNQAQQKLQTDVDSTIIQVPFGQLSWW